MVTRRERVVSVQRFERTTAWLGLEPGDQVRVRALPGVYKFQAHVRNPGNGSCWVDLYGGPKGYATHRSVAPERVIIPTTQQLQRQRRLRQEREDA